MQHDLHKILNNNSQECSEVFDACNKKQLPNINPAAHGVNGFSVAGFVMMLS